MHESQKHTKQQKIPDQNLLVYLFKIIFLCATTILILTPETASLECVTRGPSWAIQLGAPTQFHMEWNFTLKKYPIAVLMTIVCMSVFNRLTIEASKLLWDLTPTIHPLNFGESIAWRFFKINVNRFLLQKVKILRKIG